MYGKKSNKEKNSTQGEEGFFDNNGFVEITQHKQRLTASSHGITVLFIMVNPRVIALMDFSGKANACIPQMTWTQARIYWRFETN